MNLANKLTILRILLIPVFMFFLLTDTTYGMEIAAFLFIVAAITDAFDGYIARNYNQITTLGKFIDPLADKLLVSAALISLVQLGKVSALVVVIIISREFIISVLRSVAAAEGIVIAASSWGKLKTITQIIAIIVILLDNFPFKYINFPLDTIMIWTSVIFTVLSGVDYIIINKDVILKEK